MKKFVSLLLVLMLLVTLCQLPVLAEEDAALEVTVTKTDIKADSVTNESGYGSLKINGVFISSDNVNPRPQAALIDKTGKFIFPYRETYNRFRYDSDSGIVSLTAGNPYDIADDLLLTQDWAFELQTYPIYYNLAGSEVISLSPHNSSFEIEDMPSGDPEFTDYSTGYRAGPIYNGLSTVIKTESYSYNWDGSGGVGQQYSAYVIDKAGNTVFELPDEFSQRIVAGAGGVTMKHSIGWFSEGLSVYCENARDEGGLSSKVLGYMDTTGKTVIDLSDRGYTDAGRFNEGLTWAIKDSKLGYIDKTGREVIPFEYDTGYVFVNDLAAVQKDGKYGFIDKTGKTVIPFEYDNSFGSGDGLLTVEKDGKYGLIDAGNNLIVPLEYDDISTYMNGVAYAIKDGILYIITPDNGQPNTPAETPTPNIPPAVIPTAAPTAVPIVSSTPIPTVAPTVEPTVAPTVTPTIAPTITPTTEPTTTPTEAPTAKPTVEPTPVPTSTPSSEPIPWTNPYSDISTDAWCYEAVEFVTQNGLMSGVGSGKFAPNENLSRAMLTQILFNKEGKPTGNAQSTFSDVATGAWYAQSVNWAATHGIVNGYGNGKFGPGDDVTREQLAVILWRYAGSPKPNTSNLPFADARTASDYALDALKWTTEQRVMKGKGHGVLDPKGYATRAEVAQMMKNYLNG